MRVALLALLAACRVEGTFVCKADADCDGVAGGTCEDNQRCSFPDPTCSTPRRYDDSAGDVSGQCVAAKTCSEAATDDGEVTLSWGGDLGKPWTAACAGGAEYLALPAGTGTNFSQYSAGGKSPGTSVRTKYDRVRINVAKSAVDISDQRYASSSGSLMHDGTTEVTSMPFAVAMDCVASGSTSGTAQIDFTGTPFQNAVSFSSSGAQASGSATGTGATNQGVKLIGGGSCGWEAPPNTPSNPFNQIAASPVLVLDYVGMK